MSAARAATRELVDTLAAALPGRVSTRLPDLGAYARDLWPRGLLGVADGRPPESLPDAVVWPLDAEEVALVVRRAVGAGVAIVPFGGGSGVAGGTLPVAGGLVVDLKRMNRLVHVDADAGQATLEAGLLGEHLEHELNRRGLTLGHFPSSIMCSTFGGWLATRSAGQLSTRYGKIEDLVRSLSFVDGTGRLRQASADASPAAAQWLVGSEGTLGIITCATVTVRPLPEARHYRGWSFPRVAAGLEAIRRLVQRQLRPACVRLYDELDSLLHKSDKAPHGASESSLFEEYLSLIAHEGKSVVTEWKRRATAMALAHPELVNRLASLVLPYASKECLLIVGFEGERGLAAAEAQAAEAALRDAGGRDLGEEPGQRWLEHRYDVSFKMPKVFDAGAFVDTMEVATSWDRLIDLYEAVRGAIAPHAFVMAHFSHAYSDGCSIYFTFAGHGSSYAEAVRKYDGLWRAALEAAARVGATLSHHHGVGLAKAPYMVDEHGAAMAVYHGLKEVFDPHHLMNPGKMGV